MHNFDNLQEVVVIDGRQFAVHHSLWDKKAVVYLDNETIFTTNVKEMILDSGEKVLFCAETLSGRKETNIVALKNVVEMNRFNRIREKKRQEYEKLRINSIDDVIANASRIGKVELTMNNGGYGNVPILAYGYIALKKNTVIFKLGDDEEIAKTNTLEALQYLFFKEIEKRYGESKFSHQGGKKKKVLTKSEMEAKKDFDSLVREALPSLTIENALENLEFLEEYYQELMK